MQPISRQPQPNKPPVRTGQPVRFGSTSGGSGGVGGLTGMADTVFQLFQNSRGKEMIVEDVVGFGVLRTGMDLGRDRIYGGDSLNVPAAAERFFREMTSIFTDCVLGGLVAYGLSKAYFDRNNKAFSGKFVQYPSLELFQDVVNSEQFQSAKNHQEAGKAFAEVLTRRAKGADKLTVGQKNTIQNALKLAWDKETPQKTTSWFRANPNAETFNQQGKTIINALSNNRATDFGWDFHTKGNEKPVSFAVNDLLDDVNRFGKSMEKAWAARTGQVAAHNWQDMASEAIKKTINAKNFSIPFGLATGMAATFTMPMLGNWMTKKVYGIDYFPGETSLRKGQQQGQTAENAPQNAPKKSLVERYFPYVTQSAQNGNVLPLGLALTPMIAALGFVDTYKRSFINPFKSLKNGDGALKKLFDYTKAAPFTSQQQMAAMFALLITSRLLSSRSDNEYKERILDSALGWGAWIVGTPLMKIGLSKLFAPELLNKGSLKSREAIEAFAESGVRDKLLKSNIRIGIFSTLATIGILGLGAPFAGMKLTQWNEQRKQTRQNPQPGLPPQPPGGNLAFPAVARNSVSQSAFPGNFSAAPVSQPFLLPQAPSVNPYAFPSANPSV